VFHPISPAYIDLHLCNETSAQRNKIMIKKQSATSVGSNKHKQGIAFLASS
jgi:hypothetical protein